MSAAHSDQIVEGYLSRLNAEAVDLPRAPREELLSNVREHIAEARSNLPNETDADLLNVLDRLGEPADLVQEARDRFGIQRSKPFRPGPVEIGAIVLLRIFWVAGVVLLWVSNAWNTRDKLIGTFLPPGGFAALPIFALVGLTAARAEVYSGAPCVSSVNSAGNVPSATCSAGPPDWAHPILSGLVLIAFALLLVLPVLTSIYLAIRLRRGRALTSPAA